MQPLNLEFSIVERAQYNHFRKSCQTFSGTIPEQDWGIVEPCHYNHLPTVPVPFSHPGQGLKTAPVQGVTVRPFKAL
jgi:hypothetical protein